jgi:hypothetical protein
MGSTYAIGMTRKDKMREGFVARTFHIPIEIDDELNHIFPRSTVRIFLGHWEFQQLVASQ